MTGIRHKSKNIYNQAIGRNREHKPKDNETKNGDVGKTTFAKSALDTTRSCNTVQGTHL